MEIKKTENIFEKLENCITNSDSGFLSDLISYVSDSDHDEAVLYANLEKIFTNIAYKMFAENGIELNYDLCLDINNFLLMDRDILDPDNDVFSIMKGIENMVLYYKNIDMFKELEDKIIDCRSLYLNELIDEVASDNVDFYTDDLFEALKDLYHEGYYDKAIGEFNLEGDILGSIRKAQYFKNRDILLNNRIRIFRSIFYKKLSDAKIVLDSKTKYDIIYKKTKFIGIDNNIYVMLEEIDDFIDEYRYLKYKIRED